MSSGLDDLRGDTLNGSKGAVVVISQGLNERSERLRRKAKRKDSFGNVLGEVLCDL